MNTKKLGCFLVLIFISFISNAQSWMWANEANASFGAVDETMYDHFLAIDKYGNYYETGSIIGDTITFNGVALPVPGFGGSTFYLNKYNANGILLWAKEEELDSNYYGAPFSIALDDSDNIFVAGYFSGTIVSGSDTLKASPLARNDGFLIKFDPNGNTLWARENGDQDSGSLTFMNSLVTDNSGNVYVTGSFNDTIYFGSYTLKSSPSWSSEAFVVKYDRQGNVVWAKQGDVVGNASFSAGNSIATDASKQYFYVAGNFFDTVSFGGNALMTTNSNNVFLIKYDANGNVIWAKQSTVPIPNFDCIGEAYSVAVDGSNGIYVTGDYGDTLMFDNQSIYTPSGGRSVFLVKYNANGNVVWAEGANLNPGTTAVGYSVACDTLKRGGGYMEITTTSGIGTTRNVGFANDTFNSSGMSITDIVLNFDSSGHTNCSLYNNLDEDDGTSVATDRSGAFLGVGGDIGLLASSTIGTIPLHPAQDWPYVARWQKCCPQINSTISAKPDTCDLPNGLATVNAGGVSAPFCYTWLPSGGRDSVANLSAGTYVVIVTDSDGCAAFDTATISSVNNLLAQACCDTTINENASTVIDVDVQNDKYLWSPSVGLNCDTCQSTIASPTVTTQYYVTVTKGGCRYIDSVLIKVKESPCTGKFYIPNAFTPNKDNKNDLFYPQGECLASYNMNIFDRWGNLLYSGNSEPWDGKYLGKVVPEDTYVYQLTIIDNSEQPHTYNGRVTVLK
jgi:gliding motility-associated-like protein